MSKRSREKRNKTYHQDSLELETDTRCIDQKKLVDTGHGLEQHGLFSRVSFCDCGSLTFFTEPLSTVQQTFVAFLDINVKIFLLTDYFAEFF